jgi:glycine cleavage system H lipoate-binding protein
MSILFVLLMFLLVMSISYFRTRQEAGVRPETQPRPQAVRMQREYGFSIPEGYSFHPGHTWAHREGPETARVGLDSFAGMLIGRVDSIDVLGLNRWVRQGQRIAVVKSGDLEIDLVSPIEGVVTAVNRDIADDPSLIARDPYEAGWIALVKSPDLTLNQKNLVQGSMVAPWMQNSVTRLNGLVAQLAPTMAADGGLPMPGLLARSEPEVRTQILKEFFLA